MAAILQTSGPISTCQTVRTTWRFAARTTAVQYQAAAVELEKLNLGKFVTIFITAGRASKVFIKKPPQESAHVLVTRPDLCDPSLYARKFERPSPKTINAKVKAKLVELGLVEQKYFEPSDTVYYSINQ